MKADFRSEDEADKARTIAVMDTVMQRYLAYLHPYMPHITEELSRRLGFVAEGEFLMNLPLANEPVLAGLTREQIAQSAAIASSVYESAGKLRNLKAEYNVANRKDVRFVVKPTADWVAAETGTLALLAGASEIDLQPDYDAPKGTPAAVTDIGEVYMPLEGLIDVEAEKSRLDKEIAKMSKEVQKCQSKLGNSAFIDKAPTALVDREKERLAEWQQKLSQLQEMRSALA